MGEIELQRKFFELPSTAKRFSPTEVHVTSKKPLVRAMRAVVRQGIAAAAGGCCAVASRLWPIAEADRRRNAEIGRAHV